MNTSVQEAGGEMPEAIQYMPKGKQSIYATVNNKSGYAPLNVTREAAEVLQRDFETIQAEVAAGKRSRPVLYFDHKTGPAAGIPKKFSWDDEKGVLLELDWTGAGRDAVMNQNYSYFSPTFRVDMETGEVLGLHRDATEVGSLVNRPAIENIGLIAASRPEGEEQPPAYGVVVEVMAANPYGCNQYGEGWKAPHNGTSTSINEDGKKEQKKEQKSAAEEEQALKELWRDAESKGWTDERQKAYEAQEKRFKEAEEREKKQEEEKDNAEVEKIRKMSFKEVTDTIKQLKNAMEGKKRAAANAKKKADWAIHKTQDRDAVANSKDKEKDKRDAEDAKAEARQKAAIAEQARLEYEKFVERYKKAHADVTAALAGEDLSPRGGVAEGEKKPDNGDTAKGGGFTTMDEKLKKRLGCDEKADDAAVTAAMIKCMDERDALQKKLDALKGEKDKVDAELKAAKAEAADAFVNDLKARNVIAPHDEARISAAKAVFEANPAQARALFDGVALTTDSGVKEGSILAGKPEGAAKDGDNSGKQAVEDVCQRNIAALMGIN